jgi:hypothetical protein
VCCPRHRFPRCRLLSWSWRANGCSSRKSGRISIGDVWWLVGDADYHDGASGSVSVGMRCSRLNLASCPSLAMMGGRVLKLRVSKKKKKKALAEREQRFIETQPAEAAKSRDFASRPWDPGPRPKVHLGHELTSIDDHAYIGLMMRSFRMRFSFRTQGRIREHANIPPRGRFSTMVTFQPASPEPSHPTPAVSTSPPHRVCICARAAWPAHLSCSAQPQPPTTQLKLFLFYI